MKISILLLVFVALVVSFDLETEIKELIDHGFEKSQNKEYHHYVKNGENVYDTVILALPNISFDPFSSLITLIKNKGGKQDILKCKKDSTPNYFKWAATSAGHLGKPGQSTVEVYNASCFAKTTFKYEKLSASSIKVTIEAQDPTSELCTDVYLLATFLNYELKDIFTHGTHTVTFKNLNEQQMTHLEQYGLHIFRFCDEAKNILPDLLMTALQFLGGFTTNPDIPFFGSKPAFWQEIANEEFIKRATGYQWERRTPTVVDIDEKEIHSGDFLAVTRFDGLDQIIEYGTGSRAGHSTVALWIDDVLHILESQNAWYFPKKRIQRNTFKQWKEWAHNAGFNVAILPLSPESRAKFNVTAAYEWFKTVEGLQYGYHNFLFGWIDTPYDNLPSLLDLDFVMVIFSILDKIKPEVVSIFIGEALNKRLNTTGLNLEQITAVLDKKNMTFNDLVAIVEEDDWVYSDGYSMVCSSFVAALYKAGGLFGNLSIQATEFTPKDVYQLNFFDKNYVKPEVCQKADPDLPYCQIMGSHKMKFEGYNTINPYDHMNERCPSLPPDYIRPDGC